MMELKVKDLKMNHFRFTSAMCMHCTGVVNISYVLKEKPKNKISACFKRNC